MFSVTDAKRLMGRKFSDASVSDIKLWPFKVTPPGPGEKPLITVLYRAEDKQFATEENSSMVLIKIREIGEAFLDSSVKE